MTDPAGDALQKTLSARYSDALDLASPLPDAPLLHSMLGRGSCRSFSDAPVSQDWIDVICAAAFAAPTKSDLQQRDLVLIRSPDLRRKLAGLVAGQAWVAEAPMIAVFCGNNRRQRLLHDWHGVPFANDHLDALFNAIGDAAIALGAFVTAAEALGLGCCPISAVRNRAAEVADLLHLPDHVFPFAGLAFGHPKLPPVVSKRLPLGVTCHTDRYDETGLQDHVAAYDSDRAASQPYGMQRFVDRFGESDPYTWSEDKVRQYSAPEREGFGAYIRASGFRLE